jgi:hypothetical protein
LFAPSWSAPPSLELLSELLLLLLLVAQYRALSLEM